MGNVRRGMKKARKARITTHRKLDLKNGTKLDLQVWTDPDGSNWAWIGDDLDHVVVGRPDGQLSPGKRLSVLVRDTNQTVEMRKEEWHTPDTKGLISTLQ